MDVGIQNQDNRFGSNNAGRQTITGHLAVYFWSFCASLKSTDKLVFVSMMWTITTETRGLLAVLILIIYCITMRKTISVTSTMMITGFSAPPVRRSLSIFLIFWWFVNLRIFHVIFLEPFYLLMHNSSPPNFLFYCMPIHLLFFAMIQLFGKLSSENNSTKMFIKILKSISSYVYRCSLGLFIAALFGESKRHARSPLSFPLFI